MFHRTPGVVLINVTLIAKRALLAWERLESATT